MVSLMNLSNYNQKSHLFFFFKLDKNTHAKCAYRGNRTLDIDPSSKIYNYSSSKNSPWSCSYFTKFIAAVIKCLNTT